MKDYSVQVPNIIQDSCTVLNWNIKDSRQVFLTFDDGPTPSVTSKVLDILQSYQVKGTFFCIGRNVERHLDLFDELSRLKMGIGNHTYSHLNGWESRISNYCEDVELANNFINSNLFRPPYGRIRPRQTKQIANKYTIFMWDVLTKDYDSQISGKDCFNNVKNHVRDGSIIVFHDSLKAQKNLEYALPKTIDFLLAKGYTLTDVLS